MRGNGLKGMMLRNGQYSEVTRQQEVVHAGNMINWSTPLPLTEKLKYPKAKNKIQVYILFVSCRFGPVVNFMNTKCQRF